MQQHALLVLLLAALPAAASQRLGGEVYTPTSGVVCDRKAQFCADAQGISLGLTREYLGAKAEDVMLGRIRDAGGPAGYDLTWFAFSNGVDCKTRQQVCYVSKHSDQVDTGHTRALFGR